MKSVSGAFVCRNRLQRAKQIVNQTVVSFFGVKKDHLPMYRPIREGDALQLEIIDDRWH